MGVGIKHIIVVADHRIRPLRDVESHLMGTHLPLLALKRECEGCQVLNSVSHVYLKLMSLMTEMERFLEECREEEIRKEVLELYVLRSFL